LSRKRRSEASAVSLQASILELIGGITDASIRTSIVTAISAMADAYRRGRITEEELRRDLANLCFDVLDFKNPFKDAEELRKEAERWAERLLRLIKLESMRMRYLTRLSSSREWEV